MIPYVTRRGERLLEALLRLPEHVIDRATKVAAALTVVVLLGFGAYYSYDRYYRPVPPLRDLVLRQLEEQVMADPQSPEARVQVGWAYLDRDLPDQALSQFGEALKLREDFQAALIGQGNALVRKGELNAASVPFERVAELNKDNPFKRTLRELQGVYYYLGTIYSQQNREDDAVEAFTQALEIDRADADSLYGLGQVYIRQGRWESALPVLERAVRLDPVFEDGYRSLQVVYEHQGMVGHALLAKGMLNFIQAKYDDALVLLRQSVQTVPNLAEGYQALGLVYEKKGQRKEALEAFQVALERSPELPLAQAGVVRLDR